MRLITKSPAWLIFTGDFYTAYVYFEQKVSSITCFFKIFDISLQQKQDEYDNEL